MKQVCQGGLGVEVKGRQSASFVISEMPEELPEMEVPSTDCDNHFCFTRLLSAQQR